MVEAWGKRHSFSNADVDDLFQQVLMKVFRAMPTFQYDPTKTFRGWLRTIIRNEAVNLVNNRNRKLMDTKGLGHSSLYEILLQHPDKLEDLTAALEDRSEALNRCFQHAIGEIQELSAAYEESWEAFRRVFLEGAAIESVADELAITYYAQLHGGDQ